MSNIPFTPYDFFAYLSSGGLIVAAVDLTFGRQWLLQDKIGPPAVVFLILTAYIAGHLVAHFSSMFIERGIVDHLLGDPTSVLLGEKKPTRLRHLFPGYFRPLPDDTQARVRARAAEDRAPKAGDAFFLHVYASVGQDENVQARLDQFRNLYGFSRNMSFALLLSALVLIAGYAWGHGGAGYPWAITAAAMGIAMLYRYLKFYRQFSYELLLRYAGNTRPILSSRSQ